MSTSAVLVVDMLNAYGHPDADRLISNVEATVEPLGGLLESARADDDVEVVYVNDNYGDFSADRASILGAALEGRRPDLVEPIAPCPASQFMIKVRHSALYSTPLGYLSGRLDVERVIITGQVTEQCILYTALDAYVRHFDLVVPPDTVAHIDDELCGAALKMMERNMAAKLVPAAARS
jgi:nicotinamidase-related amidase